MVGVSITSLDGSVCAQHVLQPSAPPPPLCRRAAHGAPVPWPAGHWPCGILASQVHAVFNTCFPSTVPQLSLSRHRAPEVRVLDGGNSQH